MWNYPGPATTLGVREGRDRFAALLDTAQTQPVFIERHGQPVAVVISPEVFQRLHDAWEDLQDLTEIEDFESLPPDHPDRETIPWEQVEKDLGWVS